MVKKETIRLENLERKRKTDVTQNKPMPRRLKEFQPKAREGRKKGKEKEEIPTPKTPNFLRSTEEETARTIEEYWRPT